MDGTLRKTQHVLQHADTSQEAGYVGFTREPDEDGDLPVFVLAPCDMWEEFGSPATVTVTIEPGDNLNP